MKTTESRDRVILVALETILAPCGGISFETES
jgi:hypothetical protein